MMEEHNVTIPHPTWTQLRDAILRMDGRHSNEVEVGKEHVGSLIIGGGDEERYIVTFTPEDLNSRER